MIGLKMEKKEAIEHLISVMDENGTIFRGGVDSILKKEIEEKTIEACRVLNFGICANGHCYDNNSKGFLGELMAKMYEERKFYKKKMIEAKTMLEKTKDPKYENEVSKYHNFQLVRKVCLNSCYGSIGNKWFRFYSRELAESITLSGQLSIRWIMNCLNEFLNKQMKTQDYDYVVASDTDSVVGESLIYVNGKKIAIQDYFVSCGGEFVKNDSFNDDYVKMIENGDVSYSVSNDGLVQEKKIKYIMKHKVKKRMYRISDDKGNAVVVTQDHSIVVRNKKTNKISEIKPSRLNTKIHEIINIHDGVSDTDRKATNDPKQDI